MNHTTYKPAYRKIIRLLNIIILFVFVSGCQFSSTPPEPQRNSEVFPWSEQQKLIQTQIKTQTSTFVPLMAEATVKNGIVISTELLFGTPVQGAFRISYEPQRGAQSLKIEQEVQGKGFWFDEATRREMTQGFNETSIGPSDVYHVFEEYMLQTGTTIQSNEPVTLHLDLFRPELLTPFPVWRVSYADYNEGTAIEIWVDAKTADIVKATRDSSGTPVNN